MKILNVEFQFDCQA